MGFESLTGPDCSCCDRSGGGGTGTVNLPGCVCQGVPTTLNMTSSGDALMFWQSCTIHYGPPPSDVDPVIWPPTSNFWFSTAKFTDLVTPASPFYYTLGCNFNIWTLVRYYPSFQGGPPLQDGPCVRWNSGSSPNTCGAGSLNLTVFFQDVSGCAPEASITLIG